MKKILATIMFLIVTTTLGFSSGLSYEENLNEMITDLQKKVSYVVPLELKKELSMDIGKDVYLLDIRTSTEVTSGGSISAPRYINIPRGLIEFKIKESVDDLGSKIVVVCYSELRSLFVSERLKELGYKHVRVMSGGMERWNRECLPKDNFNNLFIEKKGKSGCGSEKEGFSTSFFKRKISGTIYEK